ncbi:hypothetical protein pfor_10c0782 [Rhodobacteraceae bacterium SB2]|nr:hypothetical protein pfor_10c0782 [Rhodobacteraceae bacterium SB2]
MALPIISENVSQTELDDMMDNALTASNFLKAISHEGRLMILCHLASGENLLPNLNRFWPRAKRRFHSSFRVCGLKGWCIRGATAK